MVNRGANTSMALINRRGFFFTIIIIAILSLVLFSSVFYSEVQERQAIQQRIKTMNAFLFSLEEDIERNMYIAGYRSLFLLEKKIIESGNFINNVNASVQELFYNGTLDGVAQDIMIGAKFSDIETALRDKARVINVNVSLTQPSFALLQDNPWKVKAVFSSQLLFVDMTGLATWNVSLEKTAVIPLNNFEDPLYIVYTNGQVPYKIVETPYSVFVQGNDVSNLTIHVEGHYYIASSLAPSFLDRLEGRFNANPQGIESLAELSALSAQGISTEAKSVVEYIYFSGNNPTSHQISGMPSWFRLDDAHLAVYNASHLSI